MTHRQRVERRALGVTASACAAVFLVLVGLAVSGDVTHDAWQVTGIWGTGLTALLALVVGSRIGDDPGQDPRYLASIAHGLRQEWHRGDRLP